MNAYTGTMTKAATLAQLQSHYDHDEIAQGIYWQRGKGCAVGCLTHRMSGAHDLFPDMFGMPSFFAHLIDAIFEGLTPAEAKEWPLRIMSAVAEGADIEHAMDGFVLWLLRDLEPVAGSSLDVVRRVADLYEPKLRGEVVRDDEWAAALDAALDAAWAAWAARAAAEAAGDEFWTRASDALVRLCEEEA